MFLAYYKCQNDPDAISSLNDGICGKINQEFCYGTTAGTIITLNTLWNICPYNSITDKNHCVEGTCQGNVTQYANYLCWSYSWLLL